LKETRVPPAIVAVLEAGAGVIVPTSQRQAALRAAWAESQRAAGRKVWTTPRIVTLAQIAEAQVREHNAREDSPDEWLPPTAEWALLREFRRDAGGIAEARALQASVRLVAEWNLPTTPSALGGSPESELLAGTLRELESLAARERRKPLREWLKALPVSGETWVAAGFGAAPPRIATALAQLGANAVERSTHDIAPIAIATADDDDHEIELIAGWCREQLERDPTRRLLVVDARLRARRRAYERVLSQTLTPGEWVSASARRFSTVFAIEGGQALTDFPIIAHALLTLRLLTKRLPFVDIVRWLRLPFLDQEDVFAGPAIEAELRDGRQLEFGAPELAAFLERDGRGDAAKSLAARLRRALALLAGEKRSPSEWSPALLAALREVGWHGTRTLRSDEQQTVARWLTLLDEYAALGAWLPRTSARDAVQTLDDLAAERSFDPASVDAPIMLTDSWDDPIVRLDGIWVAGLDAAQWPPPPRPDVFVPLRLQSAAGVPTASAAGQTRRAREALEAWRAATPELVCSWARLDGDAHRTPSPLLSGFDTVAHSRPPAVPLAQALRRAAAEPIDDSQGIPVDRRRVVDGGVKPLTLQAECGFHAYAEVRLRARELESPMPGIEPRIRGMLLHKALELVWLKLHGQFALSSTAEDRRVWRAIIAPSVEAAVASVFRARIPPDLAAAVDRERMRLERLIERSFEREIERAPFSDVEVELQREVDLAGGRFDIRIDRIDRIEGGGHAIIDYKSGAAKSLRWDDERFREPQLLAYLFAERGRDIQALANFALTDDAAAFKGRAAKSRLLPGVKGAAAEKVPEEEIAARWQGNIAGWILGLQSIASRYLAGDAPVEPANDVCRQCRLTILCRRLELAEPPEDADRD
jgi:ATP-dependent helicase/nuclease subunit B